MTAKLHLANAPDRPTDEELSLVTAAYILSRNGYAQANYQMRYRNGTTRWRAGEIFVYVRANGEWYIA